MHWDELAGQLAAAGLATAATSNANGQPHVSVVATAVEGDGLWFLTSLTSGKAKNLAENRRIALLWRPQAEIYLTADVELVHDGAEKSRVWHSGLLPYDPAGFFGSPDNPDLVLIRVKPTAATVVSISANGLIRQRWRR